VNVSGSQLKQFQKTVLNYYAQHGRHDLPWRQPEPGGSVNAYKILVSELMLQQTQVPRVIPKYQEFISLFPTVQSLAIVPLGQVIAAWSGLGYNRRAKYLHDAAQQIVQNHNGQVPNSIAELVKLPGVGHNTAGAVMAYAYNQPAVFIETNVRTVFIYHFFRDQKDIPDKRILHLVAQTLPEGKEQPKMRIHSAPGAMRKTIGLSHYRLWYWALMDYGSFLKQSQGNLSKLSKSYVKQSAFHGSRRQLRGQVLRDLAVKPTNLQHFTISDERLPEVLQQLEMEGLIQQNKGSYSL
jgi:A/G-specific adenine glycosylase